jgi:hypothetical protein
VLGVNFPEWAELAILGAVIYGSLIVVRHRPWRELLRALRHDDSGIKGRGLYAVRRVNMIPVDSPKARVRT